MSRHLGPTSDFSPVAARYDATRHIPPDSLLACYDRLIAHGLFPAGGHILDAGCGTGQISLPLAARGYAVRGFDIAAEMVALARAKCPPGGSARYAVADVRALPVAAGTFDAVVVSKLFMHIADWRAACRELIRAARPGAPIVHIRDRDAYGNRVRRHFTARVRAAGHARLFLGPDPRDTAVAEFLAARGCRATALDMKDIGWRFDVTAGETLRGLRERIFAEFWYLPETVYAGAMAETVSWVEAQPGGMDRAETMTPWLSVEVFQTPG